MQTYKQTIKIGMFIGIVCSVVLAQTLNVFASPLVYVLSEVSGVAQDEGGIISIIDINDAYSITHVAEAGLDGVQTIATSPDHTTAYVSDRHNNVVYVINTESGTVEATIPVNNDGEIVISPDGTKGYIPDKSSAGNIWTLDLTTNTVSGSISVPHSPFFLALSPDGTRLYGNDDSQLYVIDATTDTLITAVNTSGGGQDLVVSPDGSKVYAVTYDISAVSVLDTATNLITNTIEMANPALGVGVGIDITTDGTKLYAANDIESKVTVIDTATETVSSTIDLGADKSPTIVVIAPDGTKAFVMNSHFNTGGTTEVAVIDTASDTLSTTISVPNAWWSFALGVIDREFTSTGTNVEITPTSLATLTFSEVTATGDTTVSATSTPPSVPEGFKLSKGDIYFDITTTATFTGTVQVCVNYTSDQGEGGLKFLHEESGVWVDRTTSLDTVNNIICGEVTSFSFFMVALQFGLPTQTFVRSTGEPIAEVVDFFSVDGDATLVIENGPNGTGTTASAIVKLNGETLALPKDFDNKHAILEIPVALPFGNSQLEVEIQGKPTGTLSVKII
ncbi:MAG: hypothetical protein COW88_02495 [Candidatus Lloydbacteria bacterium CG22_combo_CG10-13_8_21_14_all_47_15]|uniref:Uncharacterized protein n=1 Tax=Candidatus Lloydbacteria bacterium CG22_combo_CG10-13_8_21_14_all_47_15 TaxID=1974635 RepID=A0A2H0CU51_9BACT|nr:MAG: hypothetical protein COW88_02495 [Candidatus Lloydbacteria bacterium CG22_combo_CG10-13_8_21_14_all_47_15]